MAKTIKTCPKCGQAFSGSGCGLSYMWHVKKCVGRPGEGMPVESVEVPNTA